MRNKKLYCLLASLVFFSAALGCTAEKQAEKELPRMNYKHIKDVPKEAWKELSQKRILFAHQSVGDNIIEGIKDLMRQENNITLNIVPGEKVDSAPKVGMLQHFYVGQNGDYQSKLDHFESVLDKNTAAGAPDIAIFKFCYVDVDAGSNAEEILTAYRKTIDALHKRYPDVTFIHTTVPVRLVQTGVKAWIKKLLGKPAGGYADNLKRAEYNQMLQESFKDRRVIFDLAEVESTFPDGKRNRYVMDGKTFSAMVPDYTYDSGHLNETGRVRAAEAFLLALINNCQK